MSDKFFIKKKKPDWIQSAPRVGTETGGLYNLDHS